ncbi:hydroxyacid-oxoacid transhydrogenase [Solicola sp. PLA-1-18]|uniref:hydroxyacid-oxoacid transhydrogenase n=1 Tax=Solicola sp. PLA-1-18 TaxID=3380532 RepID=UPI003B76E8CF
MSTIADGSETVFTYGSPQLKFGVGASREVGHDLAALGAGRVLVVSDPSIEASGTLQQVLDAVTSAGVETVVYARSRVEPTDESLADAVEFGRAHGPYDAVLAVGGGSSIDTAKAVDLLCTNDGELMDYVNAPVGGGRAPSSPLLPLVAVPTTTGTGSESTTICVLDVLAQHVKTGISHPRLRPTMAVVDPLLTLSQPSGVTAAAGMDILCHALESYTARPFTSYERKQPQDRVPYCGANPVSDLWSEKALTLLSTAFRRSVSHGDDLQARTDMALASTVAGMGFGNAGVHIPHANAYPIAGQVRGFHPEGYPGTEAMVPHGMAVSLTAPEAFRYTFEASPERHLRAADLLEPGGERPSDPADVLPAVLTRLMRDVGLPSGIGAVGFGEDDVPALVEGALKQERLLATSPRPVDADAAAAILTASVELW